MQFKGLLPVLAFLAVITVILDARDKVVSVFKPKKREDKD